MAPRIPDIVDMARGILDPEPTENIEEQDEYLDRLGAIESEEPESLPEVERPIIDDSMTLANAYEATQRMDEMRREYILDFHPHGYDSQDYDSPTRPQQRTQRAMRWSNGDQELRPHRDRHWRRDDRNRDREFRREASRFIHEKVVETNTRIIDSILRDVEVLVLDMMDRIGGRLSERMIITAVDHFLEDMGDNIFLRHHIRVSRRADTFGEWLEVHLEMPDGIARHMGVDLNRGMSRGREMDYRRGEF
jgi:hypothetical protein